MRQPYDAVKAFHATGAKTLVSFHYGTFDAADEPIGEPEQIRITLNGEGKIDGELKMLKLGEVFEVQVFRLKLRQVFNLLEEQIRW